MKQMWKKISSLKRRYVYKVFSMYMVAWLFFFLFVISMLAIYSSEWEIKQSLSTYSEDLESVADSLNFSLREVRGIVDTITNAESAAKVLEEGEKYYSKSIESWNIVTSKGYRQVRYLLFSSNHIKDILLHKKHGILSIEQSELFQYMSENQQNDLMNKIMNMEKSYLWFAVQNQISSARRMECGVYIHKIYDRRQLGNFIGYAVARVPNTLFYDLIEPLNVTRNSQYFMYTEDWQAVIEKNDTPLNIEQIKTIMTRENIRPDGAMNRVKIEGRDYLLGAAEVLSSGWNIYFAVPLSDITQNVWSSMGYLVIFIFLFAFISIPFIFILSKSLTLRIGLLKNEMKNMNVEMDDKLLPQHKNPDEIDELIQTFYEMKHQNKKLMQEQYQNGCEIKELELQVLQAQINPHFLYNTLEAVYWMGVKNHVPEIQNLAQKLGSFYRISLSNGNQIVTLRDELQQVKDYTDIQNIRFDNRICLEMDIPEDIKDYQLIKLTLQPLVENAISHGIRETEGETGRIYISAYVEGQDLLVKIADDGIGMSEEQLAGMMQRNTHIIGHGYGVWNINERLKRTFGSGYGLHYESTLGKGTCVTVRVPAGLPQAEMKKGENEYE